VNVTSVQGRCAFPTGSLYAITKYGVEAFSDSLRREMVKFGVKVVVIEPGHFGGATACLNADNVRTYTSYYKLGNFCVCVSVCLSVCLCVCPAIRFHSSQRIFTKFGGNLLRVMTRSVGYIFRVCTQRARVRTKRARVCAFAYVLTYYLKNCWEHTNTHYKCQGLCTFNVHAPCARVRARMCESVRD
jgi:hypothetical protein